MYLLIIIIFKNYIDTMGCGCGTKVRTNLTKQTNNIVVNNARTSTKNTTTMRRKIIKRPAR